MASESVNIEGSSGAKEKETLKVYTRQGRGKRKHRPFFTLEASDATDSSEKLEEKSENEKEDNHVNPPETLARECVDSIDVVKNSVEDIGLEASENLLGEDSENLIDKPLVEARSQSEPQDDVSEAATDKNVIQPVRGLDGNTIESEKFVGQDDVNTVEVDENSVKETSKSLPQEDVTTVIVDKNPIEAPSQDADTVVVDKNLIEVSSEEYVHVVDADKPIKEAHPDITVETDAVDAQQTADSDQNNHATASESMPMEGDVHVASKSKQQKEEMRKKLEDQLNLVRGLVKKIEDKEVEIGAYSYSRVLVNNESGRIISGFIPSGPPREINRGPRPLSISVLNTERVNEYVEKGKRTPKANQFYRTSDFLLGDKLPPAESNKKPKPNAKKHHGGELAHGFVSGSKVYKNCYALLERLMKHKHGWVFNAPVDVQTLGLHDYFTIIEHPMDLGTIKATLTKKIYNSPREFAEDVRLTFHNAMVYNPRGQDVHVMAEVLLQMFEERWAVIEADYNREMRFVTAYESHTMRSRLGPTMPPPPINVDRADWNSHPKPTTNPGRTPRTPALKKPKANEPNKRDMTYEEKQKLSGQLQNLPPDKLDAIVQIVNRRSTAVKLKDEEYEVDIDSVDPETLWELDRFVTNYKKGLSKKKRRAELAIQAKVEAERNNNQQQMAPAPVACEFSREGGNTGKKTLATPLPHQVEKPNNESSSSSSGSSSSSSSSSDSDSDSSSSSDSDQN